MAGARAVPAGQWNALVPPDDPFLEHAFLAALEESGSVGGDTGWRPRFLLVHSGGQLVGAVPLYLKDHSYGEFIFDWGWAGGAQRAGLPYYPKLVAAVPFTPVTGARLLVHPDVERDRVVTALVEGVRALADHERVSSVHILFCPQDELSAWQRGGFAPRLSTQFHWTNRDPPYASFDDYLTAFRSRNRKQVRRERNDAAAKGLRLATVEGSALGDREWRALHRFYRANAAKHGSPTYLTPAFFELARESLAHRIVATLAYDGDEPVAGTLNFERGRHLYGRYWGALESHEFLHFELCYYALIDRAIGRGCTRFEAGAQGEHKLKRGLLAALTHSAHWIRHPALRDAVDGFLVGEADAVRAELAEYQAQSPFRRVGETE